MFLVLFSGGKVLDYCSFLDEDNDCTYEYTVDTSKDPTNTELLVEVLKKRGELQAARMQNTHMELNLSRAALP